MTGPYDLLPLAIAGATASEALGVSSSGEVFGTYSAGGTPYAFLDDGGFIQSALVAFPAAAQTTTLAYNDGKFAGSYIDANGVEHGFVDAGGAYASIDCPGATATVVTTVGFRGELAGYYLSGGVAHGFIDLNGAFQGFDYPGATNTYITSYSDTNLFQGYYVDSSGQSHGFATGYAEFYNSLDVPGALDTGASEMNPYFVLEQLAGDYTAADGSTQGYVALNTVEPLAPTYRTISYPGAADTHLAGVNAFGELAGYATDANGVDTAFVGFSRAAKADNFDGGETSDILWFNATTGEALDWALSGGVVTSETPVAAFAPGSGWSLAGTGDFDGDGTSDILLKYDVGGQTAFGAWILQNGALSRYAALGGFADNSGWAEVGVGDFTGDGTDGVLLSYNSAGQTSLFDWRIANGAVVATDNLNMGFASRSGWSVIGTGDFNGDGVTDVLLKNSVSGEIADWSVRDGSSGAFHSLGNLDNEAVLGVGDFFDTGVSGVATQGRYGIDLWQIEGGAVVGERYPGDTPQFYSFAGVGDYFGSGSSDLLYSTASGATEIWQLQSGRIWSQATPSGAGAPSGWSIVS